MIAGTLGLAQNISQSYKLGRQASLSPLMRALSVLTLRPQKHQYVSFIETATC